MLTQKTEDLAAFNRALYTDEGQRALQRDRRAHVIPGKVFDRFVNNNGRNTEARPTSEQSAVTLDAEGWAQLRNAVMRYGSVDGRIPQLFDGICHVMNYFSFDVFLDRLYAVADEVLNTVKASPTFSSDIVFLVVPEGKLEKSNLWLAAHLWLNFQLFRDLIHYVVFDAAGVSRVLRYLRRAHSDRPYRAHVLLVDDMIYSGEQMSMTLDHFRDSDLTLTFHLVVPFMTRNGLLRIQGAAAAYPLNMASTAENNIDPRGFLVIDSVIPEEEWAAARASGIDRNAVEIVRNTTDAFIAKHFPNFPLRTTYPDNAEAQRALEVYLQQHQEQAGALMLLLRLTPLRSGHYTIFEHKLADYLSFETHFIGPVTRSQAMAAFLPYDPVKMPLVRYGNRPLKSSDANLGTTAFYKQLTWSYPRDEVDSLLPVQAHLDMMRSNWDIDVSEV